MSTDGNAKPDSQRPQPVQGTASRDRGEAGPAEVSALMDRAARAGIAAMTSGMAPSAMASAWADWAFNLAVAPGKQAQLVAKAVQSGMALSNHAASLLLPVSPAEPGLRPRMSDKRFRSELWNRPPFSLYRQSFLATEAWWQEATTGIRGVDPRNAAAMEFAMRQWLDMIAPANFPATNPEVIDRTLRSRGRNLAQGALNLMRALSARDLEPEEGLKPGRDLAATPGKVVARTHLAELIQYSPQTGSVHPEPVMIVPAWIMKYYILDLRAQNSLVRYLVERGFTVFMLSWRNPDASDRDTGLADYLEQGPMAALDAIRSIAGAVPVHGVGYCLGGTLMAIAAAALARDGDARLASLSLFAAQTDFTEPGELMLFLGEAQVAMLEDMMWSRGFLASDQMSGAFTLLRARDLLWSRLVHEILMGERTVPTDLMTWNADTTRMPYRMHSEYLRRMYLDNELARGRYTVGDRPVALTDIRVPVFAVGTETDHVAPWRSVFRIGHLTETEVTFLLTRGGHNAGIVSEPGHPRRHYRILTTASKAFYRDPDSWLEEAVLEEGSWWPAWVDWLAARSTAPVPPPPMGAPDAGLPVLAEAPGTYVFQN